MTPIVNRLQLEFDVPESWVVKSSRNDAMASMVEQSALVRRGLDQTTFGAHSIATLCGVLVGDEDEVELVVTASVVASAILCTDVDELALDTDRRVEHGVECSPGVYASFFQMLSIVRDEACGWAAILLFSTPNLTLVDELIETFDAITNTVAFRSVPESSHALSGSTPL